ncbi:MAG TPA: hypothetical protein V6C81_01690 [Planktothrix sp.]|jgi:hypothetical protein
MRITARTAVYVFTMAVSVLALGLFALVPQSSLQPGVVYQGF